MRALKRVRQDEMVNFWTSEEDTGSVLTVKLRSGKPIREKSWPWVQQCIRGILGGKEKVSKANFQGKKLVIRTKNRVQTEKLLKVHLFGEAECEVEKDARRNQSKGTIVAYDLLRVSEDEIVGWLAEFGVVAAKRFMKTKRNDDGSKELEKTPTVLLTFDRPVHPNRLELDYTIYEVRQCPRPPHMPEMWSVRPYAKRMWGTSSVSQLWHWESHRSMHQKVYQL